MVSSFSIDGAGQSFVHELCVRHTVMIKVYKVAGGKLENRGNYVSDSTSLNTTASPPHRHHQGCCRLLLKLENRRGCLSEGTSLNGPASPSHRHNQGCWRLFLKLENRCSFLSEDAHPGQPGTAHRDDLKLKNRCRCTQSVLQSSAVTGSFVFA